MATPLSLWLSSAWLAAFQVMYQRLESFGICLNTNDLGTLKSPQIASRGTLGNTPISIAEEL